MIFMAWSMSFALRSTILASAISLICAWVMVPAETLPGYFEPDFSLAAFLSRKLAGGVLVMKVNERSA